MAIRFPSHLHRNRCGIFGFRVVIPRPLRVFFTSREYRLSLGTADLRAASRIALSLSVTVSSYYLAARRMQNNNTFNDEPVDLLAILRGAHECLEGLGKTTAVLTPSKVDDALVRLVARALEDRIEGAGEALFDLWMRQCSLNGRSAELSRQGLSTALNSSDEDVEGKFLDLHAAIHDLKSDQASLSASLTDFTHTISALATEDRHAEELRAVRESGSEQQALIAQFASDLLAKVAARPQPAQQRVSEPSSQPVGLTEPTLQEVISAYCDSQQSERAWTQKTLAENEAIFSLWLRIVGDVSISSYGHEQHRRYKTVLQKLPPNLNKNPNLIGKNIHEVIAMNLAPAALNTINKHLTRVAAFYGWAVRHGYTSVNPASGMLVKRQRRASEERHSFSAADLDRLFNRDDFTTRGHRESYMYWTPLIALYSGARLNEIAQLHLDDFTVREGVNVIDVNEIGEAKRLKTKAGRRNIPIHSELIRLGLLAHVEALRTAGHTRLFPELKPGRDGYGAIVSKWFARYRKRCDITEQGKVFHSFRHTFIDRLKQAGATKEKIAAIVGHEDESETFGRYGKDYTPQSLQQIVELLDVGLRHLPAVYPLPRTHRSRRGV